MFLRRVDCVEINGIDCRFSIDLCFGCWDYSCFTSVPPFSSCFGLSSAVILRSRAASSDLCMTIQDNAVDE